VQHVFNLGNHGQSVRYTHNEIGTNSRLDSLQAAVLNCRLPLLDQDNARRRELACRYWGGLRGLGDLTLPADPEGTTPVYHQLAVRTSRRDALMRHLAQAGVGSSIHYPSTLDRQPALAGLPPAGDLPVATAAAAQLLCLPMFPELTNEEVEAVCAAVRDFFAAPHCESS
jgi:dTDP-4-amino-4,6-dideoxygalactose transaminase